jgi:hypothetical protein
MLEGPKQQLSLTVQDRTEEAAASEAPLVFLLAGVADTIPAWGTLGRDRELDKFWRTEPLLAGAVSSMCFKLAALDYKLKGPVRKVMRAENMFRNAEFGQGWTSLVSMVTSDILTRDNGGFIELMRKRNNDPTDPVVGLAHLDSSRCVRTGDPEYPVIYEDRVHKFHKLRWFQVIPLVDLPSSQEAKNGLGFSAVSRVLSAAQFLRTVSIYKREKLSGKRIPAILFAQGVRRGAIEQALNEALEKQKQEGLSVYTKPVILASPDAGAPVDVKVVELAGLPDGYNEDTVMKWYITTLALAFGTDYTEFAPLPGGGLGSSTQTTVMSARSRGKGAGILTQLYEHNLNYYALPQAVTFEFASSDPTAEADRINLKFMRARERNLRVQSQELTPAQALELAVNDGDAPESFLQAADVRVLAGIPIPAQPEPEQIVDRFVKQYNDCMSAYNQIEARLTKLKREK